MRVTSSSSNTPAKRVGRVVGWVLAGAVALAAVFAMYLAWPILFASDAGVSGQERVTGYPTTVEATGEDGRTRSLQVSAPDGSDVALNAISPGDRLVVSGSGYDPSSGVYVAVCRIAPTPDLRPGPCLGGVPDTEEEAGLDADDIQWAPANWINDDWAWRLFGARAFDNRDTGAFTAYLEIPAAADDFVDCSAASCAIYTRNDHTAIDNRMQDLYLPVAFSE